MEGVTGMMTRLRHVPGCSRGGLYGPANIDFRFVGQLHGCNEPQIARPRSGLSDAKRHV